MKIVGNTVGTTMPRANLAQTDPKKPDYIIGSDVLDQMLLAMQNDIADLKYVAIKITGITNNVGTVEKGSAVESVTINWSLNKDPATQVLDGSNLDATSRSVILDGLDLKTDKTFSLAVTDERSAKATASTGITFLNGVYYGVVSQGATLNSAAILKLTRKLQSGKAITFSATAGTNQQIAYALPASYGTPKFNVGGFDGGFSKTATISFENASGYTESYDVWLSDNTALGSTSVKVS